jgi:hypothetical protein
MMHFLDVEYGENHMAGQEKRNHGTHDVDEKERQVFLFRSWPFVMGDQAISIIFL